MNICNKIEGLQYNGALAIIGAARESSLGFEYLSLRKWLRKLCPFYKIVVNKAPNYLYNYVPTVNQSYQTRSDDKFLHVSCTTVHFEQLKHKRTTTFRKQSRNELI